MIWYLILYDSACPFLQTNAFISWPDSVGECSLKYFGSTNVGAFYLFSDDENIPSAVWLPIPSTPSN